MGRTRRSGYLQKKILNFFQFLIYIFFFYFFFIFFLFLIKFFGKVTRIIFGNYDNSLLAFASYDGDISICNALPDPKLHVRIQAHTQCVTDISFSSTNELLLSVSLDQNISVWKVENGENVRSIKETCELTSCSFHPFNNNLLFVFLSFLLLFLRFLFNHSFEKGWNESRIDQSHQFQHWPVLPAAGLGCISEYHGLGANWLPVIRG